MPFRQEPGLDGFRDNFCEGRASESGDTYAGAVGDQLDGLAEQTAPSP